MIHRNSLRTALIHVLVASTTLLASEGHSPLAQEELAILKAGQAGRIQQGLLAQSGLASDHGFALLSRSTDSYGQVLARFRQTYKGVPFWNSQVLGRMNPDGGLLPFRGALKPGISLDIQPKLDSARIIEIAHSKLQGEITRFFTPTWAELVVLDSRETDGLKFIRDAQNGRVIFDQEFSVPLSRPKAPFLLAYHVKTSCVVKGKGLRNIDLVLDANTGTLLKKWDAMKYDTPSVGTGHTQYSGDVSLDTNLVTDYGQYELRDTTRATSAHPFYPGYFPGIGSQTLWSDVDENLYSYLKDTNEWGDGENYADPGVPDDANGETAAADVHFALQSTWDMYKNILGRDGIDDFGSSVISVVHSPNASGGRWSNASWDGTNFIMWYGDGNSYLKSLTCLDVAAHEMSHGVMDYMANLYYSHESGGLNEANSDIMGTMAEFYAYGPSAGAGSSIPDTGGDWLIGAQLSTEPLRYMFKPSLDGASYDNWFYGMGWDDVHYTSGPANRFFYFLSNGTTASNDDLQSPYLPGGMTGIGNQKATRIWYRALSSYVVDPYADYSSMRVGTLEAAQELFPDVSGQPSGEYKAVQNAWAAVNVGAAAGQSDPVRVTLPQPGNLDFGFRTDCVMVPAGETLQLQAQVEHATNPGVTWSLGGLPLLNGFSQGGQITEDGLYTAPIRTMWGFPVMATSVQDPLRYGVTLAISVNLDVDDDTDVDACDMGNIALWYGMSSAFYFAPGTDLTQDQMVDDMDVALFTQTFNSAFGL